MNGTGRSKRFVVSDIDFKITFALGAETEPGATLPHPLTVVDATKHPDGSLTWSNLPAATCRIEQTKLPSGPTVFLISPHLAVPGPFSVVIGNTGQPDAPATAPRQQVNLYDFPISPLPGPIGQLVAQVYACPVGQNPHNVDPSTCTDPAPAG